MPRPALHPISSVRPQFSRSRGFTLIEVIATIVVLAVIGSMASRTMLTAMDGYMRASTQAQLHSELSITLDRIERELRKIPLKAAYGSIAPDITAITANSITWGTSGLTFSGGQLNFVDSGATTAILLSDVTAFSIQAYDESASALAASLSGTACDPVRRLTVQITVQRAGMTETLRTTVFLRCTMDGAPT